MRHSTLNTYCFSIWQARQPSPFVPLFPFPFSLFPVVPYSLFPYTQVGSQPTFFVALLCIIHVNTA